MGAGSRNLIEVSQESEGLEQGANRSTTARDAGVATDQAMLKSGPGDAKERAVGLVD